MNLSQDNRTPTGGRAGGDGIGAVANSPAHTLTVGAVGFGPNWTMEDSMAASIVRLEQENEELRAEVALLREQARIMANTIEGLRDQCLSDSCREKAAADGNWGNI